MRRAALPLVLSLGMIGCGGGERTFEANEFVEEANARGAALSLGEPLYSARTGVDVYALRFQGAAAAPGGKGRQDVHDAGTLTVTEDSATGAAEHRRCEAALTLTCFRAANVALIFQALSSEELARVAAALRAMGS